MFRLSVPLQSARSANSWVSDNNSYSVNINSSGLSSPNFQNETLLSVLVRIEGYLREKDFPTFGKFQEGLSRIEISRLLRELDLNLPTDLIELYMWKNGIVDSDYVVGCASDIFSHGHLMSLEDSIQEYLFMTREELMSRTFFPIVANGGGDFLLYDLLDGQICCYSPPVLLSALPVSIFDSLLSMFQTIESCYAHNVFSIEVDNQLESNWSLECEISASLNPGSQFWK